MLREFPRIIAAGICSVLAGGLALAASPLPVSSDWVNRVWQLDDGLPNNNITGIVQTSDGYLWLGTHRGLVRFDGVRFQRIPLPGPSEMTFGLIRGLSLLHGNELWLTMAGRVAVCLKEGETNVFTRSEGLSADRSLVSPTAAVEGRDGSAWIGFADGFAYRIANKKITGYGVNEGLTGAGYCRLASAVDGQLWFANSDRVGLFRHGRFVPLIGLPTGPIWIEPARHGGIWICAGSRLLWFDGTGEPSERARLPTDSSSIEPTAVLEDRSGAVWIGTAADGLFRFNGSKAIIRVETSHNNILSLAEDREGDIWVGTAGGGLNRLCRRVLELDDNSTRLPGEAIRSMCQDSSGKLWVIGQDGGLSRQQDHGWEMLGAENGWNGDSPICLASDLHGAVWIGTMSSGLFRWREGVFTHFGTNEGLASMSVSSLFEDSKGNLWIAMGTGASVQRLRDGAFTEFVHPQDEFPFLVMVEDAAGSIWMASTEGRLLRVDGNAIVDETQRALQPGIYIQCLHTTSDGSLWIGYAGAGVGRLRKGTFAVIGTRQGLLDNYISGIANDDYGNMWFACDRGIFKVRQEELEAAAAESSRQVLAVAYGHDQSLPNLQANHSYSPASIRTRTGQILFPMDSGLVIVHPEQAHLNPYLPPVLIERMAVDGSDMDVRRSVPEPILPADHWKVEFEFTALSFPSPENVRFRYRLANWDKDWQETRQQRSVSYTRLPPGQYTFEVKTCNDAGGWNNSEAALQFRVRPFLWQTWWFRTLSVLTLATLVFAWASQRERRKHSVELERLERQAVVERERTRVAQDLHDDLGAGLTEIGLAASLAQRPNASPQRIQEHLRQVTGKVNEMVTGLDEIVWAINPRHDSVASLSHYLCDYAQHFLELSSIRCRFEVPSSLPAWSLDSEQRHTLFLAFKESLTNAIRHSGATEVRIRIRSQAGGISTIEVEDDGLGIATPPIVGPAGDGLSNMVERLKQIGGRCEIASVPSGGTQVRFIFPCAGPARDKPPV